MLTAPPDVPEITGYRNGSTVSVHVGTAITLVCRADHGDPPYRLTWTNGTHDIHDAARFGIYVENKWGTLEEFFRCISNYFTHHSMHGILKVLQCVNMFKMLQSHIIISNLAGATICLLMCSYTNRYYTNACILVDTTRSPTGFVVWSMLSTN